MDDEEIDEMILELIGAVDYDIAKNYDPECSEEPENIPERLEELRDIVKKHLAK